ncbi:Bax inhibitor-1/YccA family protein [Pseudomonas mangiferae]|uniref:Bax inhibitor-1/YccA family protein n=1 Tax=Pseudomonas mangiferae TaxID=2593654 RepID=A0A553H445_9PSED|nr:Bax inhibitor-1/YccA family protein [Pseudomonas mangiferae]TRX76522.1 Bax inhibitor-1/YccA family protein [Pseudomonas mangiferae]
MQDRDFALNPAQAEQQQVSGVLRNTYGLLALTLGFSALVAYVSQQLRLPAPNLLVLFGGFYGLLILTTKLRNSAWGLLSTFALTGFLGYTLGPILNRYLGMANGGELIASALGMTALAFLSLSAYALTTRKDMSFLSGFITVGAVVLMVGVVASIFLPISGLHLVLSGGFVLFSSAVILYQTSAIIHGGERNYILATISLYVSIYNMFISLLQILGVVSSND